MSATGVATTCLDLRQLSSCSSLYDLFHIDDKESFTDEYNRRGYDLPGFESCHSSLHVPPTTTSRMLTTRNPLCMSATGAGTTTCLHFTQLFTCFSSSYSNILHVDNKTSFANPGFYYFSKDPLSKECMYRLLYLRAVSDNHIIAAAICAIRNMLDWSCVCGVGVVKFNS